MVNVVAVDNIVVGDTYDVVALVSLEAKLIPEVRELHCVGALDEVFHLVVAPRVECVEYLSIEDANNIVGNLGHSAILLAIAILVEKVVDSNCHAGLNGVA